MTEPKRKKHSITEVEEQLNRNYWIQKTISSVLKLSLEPISLKEQVERTLDFILSVPWLSVEAKGGIFLADEEHRTLNLIAQRGLSPVLLTACAKVPYGFCLCGRAASSRKLVFANHLGKRHETRYEGIHEHGHYCIPILSGKRLLGVINMYISEGHKRNKTEEDFLHSIANTLAGVIERKQAEEALQRAKSELEVIVRKRTSKLKQLHRQNKLILDAVAEGICEVNKQGIITFINPAVISITGFEPEELIGYHFHEILHVASPGETLHTHDECSIHDTIASGVTHSVLAELYRKKDGTTFPVEYGSTPILEKGEIAGAVIVFRDISRRRRAEKELKESLDMLNKALHGTVDALSTTSETRDPYTAGHQQRVTQLACAIAEKMGLSQESIEGLRMAALLHDLGKIYVPAEFLSKPGRLTDIEQNLLKSHPQVGYEILKNINFMRPVAEIVLQHHEKLDGSGYPRGLTDKEILPEAKILSVADTTEAMASHRPYRPSLGIEKALEEISRHKGILYDPKIVDICVALFTEERFTYDPVESMK